MRRYFLAASAALAASGLAAFTANADTFGPYESSAGPIMVEAMSEPLEHPWGFAFLPGTDAVLVTERGGALLVARPGETSPPVAGVPEVRAQGQGGLLDVALDPDFERTGRIFLTYAEPVGGRRARTAVASAVLEDPLGAPRLTDLQVIFQQEPALGGGRHFGSRLVFALDGTLFVTLGDRGDTSEVQDLGTHIGKVVRINRDGSVPADNPFVGQAGALPEIWSYGHRNAQGAALRASDGGYFTVSHGAAGGDEVNRPEPGVNFGWPEVSFGTTYAGIRFPDTEREDVRGPVHYWDPSIAPSGATFYSGALFPDWRGDLFVGALKFQLISRLDFDGDAVVGEERLLGGEFGRVRDVREAPDGAIWFVTDAPDGRLYRVTPAE